MVMSKVEDSAVKPVVEVPVSGEERRLLVREVTSEFIAENEELFERLADA